jgi:hypothetical protein
LRPVTYSLGSTPSAWSLAISSPAVRSTLALYGPARPRSEVITSTPAALISARDSSSAWETVTSVLATLVSAWVIRLV